MTQAEYLDCMEWFANGERMVPEGFVGGLRNVASHFAHWEDVAGRLVANEKVIEVGCGCGMSSRIYSRQTRCPFVAVDKPEVVAIASQIYPTPGVTFYGADFNTDWVDERFGLFDTVICIDVIEHVADKAAFLTSLRRLGHDKARWILSVPIGDDENKWHLHKWHSVEEFRKEACRYLPGERVILL